MHLIECTAGGSDGELPAVFLVGGLFRALQRTDKLVRGGKTARFFAKLE